MARRLQGVVIGAVLLACHDGLPPSYGDAAPAPRPLDAAVDSAVREEALERGVPAVGVVVVAGDRTLLRRAWGEARPGAPATDSTTFNVASVTKPLTAALVLKLVEEGRLGLDDAAHRFVDLPERYAEITVRQLLTHTSGIARDLRLDNLDDPDRATYAARLDTARASSPPGSRFEYSNAGYTVLGWLVEAVEGRPLGRIFSEVLFDPLGMVHATYRTSPGADPLRAAPSDASAGHPRSTIFVSGGFGSGGLAFSTIDAERLARALHDGTLLSPWARRTAWRPAALANGRAVEFSMFGAPASYGVGWFLAEFEGRRLVTHGGGIEGYSANLYHFPDDTLTIVVLANSKGRDDGVAPVDPLAQRLARLCLSGPRCSTSGDGGMDGARVPEPDRNPSP